MNFPRVSSSALELRKWWFIHVSSWIMCMWGDHPDRWSLDWWPPIWHRVPSPPVVKDSSGHENLYRGSDHPENARATLQAHTEFSTGKLWHSIMRLPSILNWIYANISNSYSWPWKHGKASIHGHGCSCPTISGGQKPYFGTGSNGPAAVPMV